MTELVSVRPFKAHVCVDCGAKLSKFGAVRCKECNMRKVGKLKKRRRRKRK
jgi:ribosomal protein L40E